MRRLGISIYPEKSDYKQLKNYVKDAYDAGCRRIFESLLSVDEDHMSELIQKFKDINIYAKDLGYEIILDINPKVFKALNIDYKDLGFFKDLYADGIRLDQGFTGLEESLMTFNKYDLKIEINMSQDTHTIDNIIDFQPNRYNLIGSHNFYPHRYTGLDLDFFIKTSQKFNSYKLWTSCFVTSQNPQAFGPWDIAEGLPSLEMHRNMPLDVQIKHLVALDLIDDIVISNCYPTKEELESIKDLSLSRLTFNVRLDDSLTDLMKDIVLKEEHFYRGDHSDYIIRSSQSRVKYKGCDFPLVNTPKIIKKGDIIIEGNGYGHYTGELQIAKKDMENSGKSNVVGSIVDEEIFLIDYLKPWQKFAFKEI